MEDINFEYNDPYESSIDPSFFNMINPTLADLSIHNNNNGPTSLSPQNHNFNFSNQNLPILSINNNNRPHQNHHVLQQSKSIHHGQGHVGNNNTNIDPFDYNFNGNNEAFSDAMVHDQYHHNHNQHNANNNNNNNNNNDFVSGGSNFEVGSSSRMHENQQTTQPQNVVPVLLNETEKMSLDEWPPSPLPYLCSCCHVLREIIHANGIQFEKLEIHGRLGLITHAIHHQTPVNGNPPTYQMIDFCRRSLDEIKNFLAQYCVERTLAGYFILQDPMSAFYETLCTGLDWIEDFNLEGLVDNNQINSDDMVEQEGENVTPNGTSDKKNLSVQRKKAGKLKLSDLCDSFHLPIEEAAKQVDLCPTAVKKTCRKAGLARWPHRKVKSLLKQIALLGTQLDRQDAATRAKTEEEIHRLKTEMIQHCGGHKPTAMYNIQAFLPLHHHGQ